MTAKQTIISILGKNYSIKCEAADISLLEESAALLNEKISALQAPAKINQPEKLAVMAALNLAHEYLLLKQQKAGFLHYIHERITQLETVLDATLKPKQTPELAYTTE